MAEVTLYYHLGKLRHREMNSLVLDHIANVERCHELGSGPVIPRALFFLLYSAVSVNRERMIE